MKRLLPIVFLWSASVTWASEPFDLSLDEFKMYQHYKNALEDERVKKMKPEARTPAIAKDAGFKLKDLQRAIEKGDAAGDLRGKCEAAVQSALAQTPLAGRTKKVEVDVSEPHAVAYVMWLSEDPAFLNTEASYAALAARQGCPIVSTVQVWSQTSEDPKSRVFEALISGSAAANIKADRVKDFAETRYIRLFEKLKSVNRGDDFSAPAQAESPSVGK